jgi:hypothetical protein
VNRTPAVADALIALAAQLDRARASAGEDARELGALLDEADRQFEQLAPAVAASAGTPGSEGVLHALMRARASQIALADALRLELDRLGRAIQSLSAGSGAGSGYAAGGRAPERRSVLDRVG